MSNGTRSARSKRCRFAATAGEVRAHLLPGQRLARALRFAPTGGGLCPFPQSSQQLAAPLRFAPPTSQFGAGGRPRASRGPPRRDVRPSANAAGAGPRGRSRDGAAARPRRPADSAPSDSRGRCTRAGGLQLEGAARTTSGRSGTDACEPCCPPGRTACLEARRPWNRSCRRRRSGADGDPRAVGWVISGEQRRGNSHKR